MQITLRQTGKTINAWNLTRGKFVPHRPSARIERLSDESSHDELLWIVFAIEYTGPEEMPDSPTYRFGVFEANSATGELRRQGIRIKINAQPFQVLLMLLERPGEPLTRDEISRQLWPDGTFVDYEHGVNSAVNRIREALGDTASNPRYVETLPRRGYRFVAPVERLAVTPSEAQIASAINEQPAPTVTQATAEAATPAMSGLQILAAPHELPQTSRGVVQTLFVLLQVMYLAIYLGALANLAEIEGLMEALPIAAHLFPLLILTAAILIPVRSYVLLSAVFRAPGVQRKLLRIWPFLLVLDLLWAVSPFLLMHHISFGLAFASTALLVYSPFAQRSLILMGAGLPARVRTEASESSGTSN